MNYNAQKFDYRKEDDGILVNLEPVERNDYQYKYNGKEWQDELGLNMYTMDMRQYDPAIARWIVQDPIVHHQYSPYAAFDNNPVYFADPTGSDVNVDYAGRATRDENGKYIPPNERGVASNDVVSAETQQWVEMLENIALAGGGKGVIDLAKDAIKS